MRSRYHVASSEPVTECHYPAGEAATNLQAGDVILTGVKSQGIISYAIKLGAWLRGFRGEYLTVSHAALVLNSAGDIAEAEATGVKRGNVSKYDPADIIVLHGLVPDAHDQAQVVKYAESVLAARTKYGYVEFVFLAIYCLTGCSVIALRIGTAICSGFACDALTRGDWIWSRPPFAMMPQHLLRDVRAQEEHRAR